MNSQTIINYYALSGQALKSILLQECRVGRGHSNPKKFQTNLFCCFKYYLFHLGAVFLQMLWLSFTTCFAAFKRYGKKTARSGKVGRVCSNIRTDYCKIKCDKYIYCIMNKQEDLGQTGYKIFLKQAHIRCTTRILLGSLRNVKL